MVWSGLPFPFPLPLRLSTQIFVIFSLLSPPCIQVWEPRVQKRPAFFLFRRSWGFGRPAYADVNAKKEAAAALRKVPSISSFSTLYVAQSVMSWAADCVFFLLPQPNLKKG